MNHKLRARLSQFHTLFQHELVPLTEASLGVRLTPKLEQLLRIWEMVQIERFVPVGRGWVGRPARERTALARAFVAKAVLGLPTTVALMERLRVDGCLRRLCGFDGRRKLPGAWLFSRAFAALAQQDVAGAAHAALIKAQLGDQLIGHIARDATEIQAREKPAKAQPPVAAPPPRKRGHPRQGEKRPPVLTRIQRQMQGMSLSAMLADLPRACDVGSKTNSKGFKSSWIGYKLHLDVADGQIPISALVTGASVHDSQVAIPLATLTAARVTSLYDLMDAAYCSPLIRQHSRDLNHIPLIDHDQRKSPRDNPRGGQKIDFAPHAAERFKTRTQVERVNARLKDEFGARWLRVRGHSKVTAHLMLAVLVLAADQLLRLVT
ncbi:transposase [Metallibacterium scheffleri]|uniref:transposase n=1 Tax=Metallibacterium scheffleri TaxID=993689 RepID=UPI001B394024|nr:transposase [Metallibacterium scheffleri]